MSANLAKMLGQPQKDVAKFIGDMEDKFGHPSHDVRLLAEVVQAVKGKIAGLGLDPSDTTPEELYHALQAKFASDSAQIDGALGLKPDSDFAGRLHQAIEVTQHIVAGAEVWSLKPTVAKSLMLSLPPKKLMKQLHYRSTASMLKHENIGELYQLASYVESKTWQNALTKAAARLSSNDYTLGPINFVYPMAAGWGSMHQPTDFNVCNKLCGSVSIYPAKSLSRAPLVTLALMLLQSVRQLGVSLDSRSLAAVHPAMLWWASMEHLVSPERVSLNINDVAHNHLNSLSHEDSATHHGAQALLAELTGRYQSLAGEVQQAAQDSAEKLMPATFAEQYQEV